MGGAMRQTIVAIYNDGVFKPATDPVGLRNGQRVTLTVVEQTDDAPPANPLRVWVGSLSDEDAAEMLRIIKEEFG
jgi:predicted DNA-binding antitoxin AbrB/MazE fold protein